MKFDDAEYYFLNFEGDTENTAAGTHIGMYLAWLVLRGLAGESLADHAADLRARRLTGSALLFDACDGKLIADDCNDEGLAFTTHYYAANFVNDYEQVFRRDFGRTGHDADDFCSVPDTWDNFARLAVVLDRRRNEWKPPAAPMPDVDALLQQSLDALWPFVAANGFRHDAVAQSERLDDDTPGRASRLFVSEFPGGCHYFGVVLKDGDGGTRTLTLFVLSRLDAVALAMQRHGMPDHFADAEGNPLPYTAVLKLPQWFDTDDLETDGAGNACIVFRAPDEIASKLTRVRERLDATIKPLLRQMETARGLDAVRCTQPLTASILYAHPFDRIVLCTAEVARNPRLAAICDELETLCLQPDAPGPRMFASNLLAYIELVRNRAPRFA